MDITGDSEKYSFHRMRKQKPEWSEFEREMEEEKIGK